MKTLRQKNKNKKEKGFTIIEVVISIAIFAMISMALLNMFSSILKTVRNNKATLTANSIAIEQMEIIRGMEFNRVATESGFDPSGPLKNEKTLSRGGTNFTIKTDITWIDDHSDGWAAVPTNGIIASVPPDTFPYDYKKVRVRVTWKNPISNSNEEFAVSTNIVPVGLEGLSAGKGGIYLTVFDAEGKPVSGADVDITIVSNPAFLKEGKTDLNGNLWLPDLVPSGDYHIVTTKSGYSTAQTYAPDTVSAPPDYNPSPTDPDVNVIDKLVSKVGLSIDVLGSMNIKTVYFANPSNWQINSHSPDAQIDGSMAFDASGHLFVAFVDNRDTENHIYLRRFTYNAGDGTYSPSGLDVRVVNQTGASNPKLKTLPDGSLYLLWNDNRSGDNNIYLQKINPSDSTLLGSDFKVNHDVGTSLQQNADMDADQDGNLYIAWEDYRDGSWDIYGQKFTLTTPATPTTPGAGTFWASGDYKISTSDSGDQVNAKIILDRKTDAGGANLNNFYVTWQSNHSGSFNVLLSKFSGEHIASFQERIINSDGGTLGQSNPDMAYDGNGNIYVVWEDERNSSPDIYAQKIDAESGNKVWASDVKINDDSDAAARRTKPSIGYRSDTEVYISWEDNRNGDSYSNIYTAKVNSAGVKAWLYDFIISDKLESMQKNPQTLCDAGGKAVTIWQDDKSGNDNIYAARYSEMGDVKKPGIRVKVVSQTPKIKGIYPDPPNPDVVIPKYSEDITTDVNGEYQIAALEWGNYEFSVESPNRIISYDVPAPIYIAPGKSVPIVINVGS